MRTLVFICIVLVSGSAAGLVHGGVNMVLVEPYLDAAIELENQGLFASGQATDGAEFRAEYEGYRAWQKSGMVLGTVVLGASVGSLFGIVFARSRGSLPGGGDVKKSFALAGMMWLALFLVPFLKYPANPPTVGEADTVAMRVVLYVALVAISGAGAACFYRLSRRLAGRQRALAPAGYAALIAAAYVLLPGNPDPVSAPAELIDGFRAASVVGITSFWASVGLFLGLFWSRIDPYRHAPRPQG